MLRYHLSFSKLKSGITNKNNISFGWIITTSDWITNGCCRFTNSNLPNLSIWIDSNVMVTTPKGLINHFNSKCIDSSELLVTPFNVLKQLFEASIIVYDFKFATSGVSTGWTHNIHGRAGRLSHTCLCLWLSHCPPVPAGQGQCIAHTNELFLTLFHHRFPRFDSSFFCF